MRIPMAIVLAATFALPGAAEAATQVSNDGTKTILLSGFEPADVRIDTVFGPPFGIQSQLTDRRGGLVVGPGCIDTAPVVCPGDRLEITLNGGDDRIVSLGDSNQTVSGGAGADVIRAVVAEHDALRGRGRRRRRGQLELGQPRARRWRQRRHLGLRELPRAAWRRGQRLPLRQRRVQHARRRERQRHADRGRRAFARRQRQRRRGQRRHRVPRRQPRATTSGPSTAATAPTRSSARRSPTRSPAAAAPTTSTSPATRGRTP